jgi:AAA+ superfamily predicted ATPase
VQELSMLRSLPNFGNAGAVESMLSEAKKKAISRIQKENKESETKTNTNGTMTLIQEDFGIGDKKDPYETLSKMLRMDKIVTHFKEIEASIKMTDSMPQLSRPLLSNYLFLGNSGTGKTTVAKCMASIFYNMGAPNGMLPTDRCVVISAASLCGTFVGQAQDIVRKQFEEAIGGVLLIDEAYELGKSSYGEEALTTIVALLTEDDFKGKLICILAGYVKDMNQMLDTNQGARSRFASTLLFDDWNPNDCALLCVKHANDKGIQLDIKDKKISDALIKGFRDIKNRGRFANARDVETVSEMMFNAYSLRMYKENNVVKTEEDEEEEDGDVLPAYNLNDINGAVANMLEQRPQETIFDKTAAANRANRRGNVATQSATQIIQESIENQNQNENQNETKTNGADGGAEAGDGNENEMVQENVSLAPEALAARENFELALVGMNYDLQTANDVLQNIVKNGTYPDDLMQKLIELTGKSEAEICAMMLPQVEQLAESMKETLEEEERKRVAEEALRKTIQDIEDEKERIRQALEAARLLEEAARRAEEQRLEAEREELQRREDQKRREMAAANLETERQQKLRVIGRCSAGYAWVHKGNGLYNCSAGGHWHQF